MHSESSVRLSPAASHSHSHAHPPEPDLTFAVPGRPTSWKRAASGRRGRHTEAAHRIAAQRIRIVARQAVPEGWPTHGRYRLEVEVHYTGGVEELADLDAMHVGARSEVDCDNAEKLVADACQRGTQDADERSVIWEDDCQIVDERGVKRYGQPVEQTIVRVWRVLS